MEVSHGKQLALRFTGGAKRGLSGRPGGHRGEPKNWSVFVSPAPDRGVSTLLSSFCFLFHSLNFLSVFR